MQQFTKTKLNAWIWAVLCFCVEIQPIIIRALAGLQSTSEQERTIQEACSICEIYRPVDVPCSETHNCSRRLLSHCSTAPFRSIQMFPSLLAFLCVCVGGGGVLTCVFMYWYYKSISLMWLAKLAGITQTSAVKDTWIFKEINFNFDEKILQRIWAHTK